MGGQHNPGTKIIQFWINGETHETIQRIATGENRSCSSVYRELIEAGLVAKGYKTGDEDITERIDAAVKKALKPDVDRLAAINAKCTHISAAAFFMAAYAGRLAVDEEDRATFDEAASMARKLGVEYLKLPRDKSIDEFLEKAFDRMEEIDETDD